jgi:endonuclease III
MNVAAAAVRKKGAASSGVDAPEPAALLKWYDRHRRHLPWRAPPGKRADPYHVWLSEIMLQQTTVKAVGPYYMKFLQRWPDVVALAKSPLDDVLKAWAGLGYYARARNLHACAIAVAGTHGGQFPETEEGLRALPGVGGYTSAAIAAIAFDRRAVAIDGNIERVIARLYAIETELPAAKTEIRARAEVLLPPRRFGEETGLRHLPVDRLVRSTGPRRCRDVSTESTEGGKQAAKRRVIRGDARRWLRAGPHAAVKGLARQHDRGAVDGMDASLR